MYMQLTDIKAILVKFLNVDIILCSLISGAYVWVWLVWVRTSYGLNKVYTKYEQCT